MLPNGQMRFKPGDSGKPQANTPPGIPRIMVWDGTEERELFAVPEDLQRLQRYLDDHRVDTVKLMLPQGEVRYKPLGPGETMTNVPVGFPRVAMWDGTEERELSIDLSSLRQRFDARPDVATTILPPGCLRYAHLMNGYEVVFLDYAARKQTVLYHNSVLTGVPYPRLIFAFTVELPVIRNVHIAAVVDDTVTEDTLVYRYPYSNVYDNYSACWHGIPSVKSLAELATLPNVYLVSPNDDAMYEHANNSGMGYRELMESLQDKPFPQEFLIPTGLTFRQWSNRVLGLPKDVAEAEVPTEPEAEAPTDEA